MSIYDVQHDAWLRWKAGDRERVARLFFKWYGPLIGQCARRYSAVSRNEEFEDYQQMAREALLEALDDFDPTRGRLAGLIEFRVNQRLARRLTTQNGAFTIPSSRKERTIQLNFSRDVAHLESEQFAWSDIRTILAEKYNVHPRDIDALHSMRHGRVNVAWESNEQNDRGRTQLESDDAPAVDTIAQGRAAAILQELFEAAGLNEREQHCIRARFADGEEVAFETLAAEYGVSRERARQYVRNGLQKVAEVAAQRGLTFEDLW